MNTQSGIVLRNFLFQKESDYYFNRTHKTMDLLSNYIYHK